MLEKINQRQARVTFLNNRRVWAANDKYRWAFEKGLPFSENVRMAQSELGDSLTYYRVKHEG